MSQSPLASATLAIGLIICGFALGFATHQHFAVPPCHSCIKEFSIVGSVTP